ncbi:MAG: chlorite dismutase family protein [Gemmatimonadota bacterium]
MAEQTSQTLNHFALFSFHDEWWRLPEVERRGRRQDWLGRMCGVTSSVHLYQTQGMQAGTDLLVWSALDSAAPEAPARFFGGYAAALWPLRGYATQRDVLWGFTRPSQYTKVRSTQEIDPFAVQRCPYLVMYPFVKTTDWYLKSREERQEMMGAHIKVGKQYPDITQLLLYSFGVQDQEFVVVYETTDLLRFSSLVSDLRGTEVRRYTQRDYPLYTGIFQPDTQALDAWL